MLLSFAAYLPSIAIAAAIVYAAFHLALCAGTLRRRKPETQSSFRISVIVAARNESDRIQTLLQALHEQTHAPDEIIIVDDRSDDGTAAMVEGYRTILPQLQVVKITDVPPGVSPKKNALESGIRRTTCEILCFTDADCLPPPTWIARIASTFGERTGVVAGLYAPLWDDPLNSTTFIAGTLRRFIEYERFKTSALLLGSIGVGFPWLVSGSNLAYRRRVFDEVGGFSSLQHSIGGDDDLFVQRVRRLTTWDVVAVAGPDTTVRTQIPGRWSDFVRQRMRHFSASKHYDPVTSALLALYHGSNVVASAALFAAILSPVESFATAYVVKLSADLVLLVTADLRIQRSRAWTWFIPLELMNVLYLLVVGPLGWFSRVRWKERPVV